MSSRQNRRTRTIIGATIVAGTMTGAAGSAQAEDITVTTRADGGAGSLREAMTTADATPATKDRILFQSGLSGTITLESSLPGILGPLEIAGPGMDRLKIDGAGQYLVFASAGDLTISGLTVSRGAALVGGGIQVSNADLVIEKTRVEESLASQNGGGVASIGGHLTLTDSIVSGNTASFAGGVLAYTSSVTIEGSEISGNEATATPYSQGGGALLSLLPGSESSVRNTVISGNKAASGAGMLASGGDLAIDSSLISGNVAGATVGGVALGFPMAGPTQASDFSITNSTVAGNDAKWSLGGLATLSNDVTVDSTTITGNRVTDPGSAPPEFGNQQGSTAGGLLQAGGEMDLRNSIVSGNLPKDFGTTAAITDPVNVPAGQIAGSFSLIGTPAPGAVIDETVPNSNITGSDPALGPLADNGGPVPTMLPSPASPVVNKGATALTVDGRGLTRPVDFDSIPFSTAAGANGADIGAVELQGGPVPPPPPPEPPSNAFSFGWVKLNKKKGVASLQVNVPGPGRVLVVGSKTVAKFTKAAKKAGIVTVTIKAKGKAAKQLKKKGRAKVKAKVSFTPTGGTPRTKSKVVKLAKKKTKKTKKTKKR